MIDQLQIDLELWLLLTHTHTHTHRQTQIADPRAATFAAKKGYQRGSKDCYEEGIPSRNAIQCKSQ